MFRKIPKQKVSKQESVDIITTKPAQSWRGILFAAIVIAIILGIIAVSIVLVTPKKYLRKHKNLSLNELILITQDTDIEKIIWHEGHTFFYYTNKALWEVKYVSSTFQSSILFHFSTDESAIVHEASISPDNLSWLVEYDYEYGSHNHDQKFFEVVTIGKSRNFDADRFQLKFTSKDNGHTISPLLVKWGMQNREMVAIIENNIYATKSLSQSALDFGFVCLTCAQYSSPDYAFSHTGHAKNLIPFWMSKQGSTKCITIASNAPQKSNSLRGQQITQSDRISESHVILFDLNFDSVQSNGIVQSENRISETPGVIRIDAKTFLADSSSSNVKSDEPFLIQKASWIDAETVTFLCFNVDSRKAWITLCRVNFNKHSKFRCRRIWHFESINGILRKVNNPGLIKTNSHSFAAVLPHFSGKNNVANIKINDKGVENLEWISPKEYDVESLEFISSDALIFISSFKVEGSRHLLRFDRKTEETECLSCMLLSSAPSVSSRSFNINVSYVSTAQSQNSIYRRIVSAYVSPEGNRYGVKWSTGLEFLPAVTLNRSSVAELRNILTGDVTELGSEIEELTDETKYLRKIPTCPWPNEDLSVMANSILVFKKPDEQNEVPVWSRYELEETNLSKSAIQLNHTKGPQLNVTGKQHNRKRREAVFENGQTKHDDTSLQTSAKQQYSETSEMLRKERLLRLFDHQPLGFPFLLIKPTILEEAVWVPYSVLRCVRLNWNRADEIGPEESVNDSPSAALLRIWYPPMIKEHHITKVPFLMIIRSVDQISISQSENLLKEFAFHMACENNVMVAQVEDWIGPAKRAVHSGNLHKVVNMYKLLYRTMLLNYHYIDRKQTAFITSPGAASYLAAILLASDLTLEMPRCGILIAPTPSPIYNVRTDLADLIEDYGIDPFKLNRDNLSQNSFNFQDKSILLIHDFLDKSYPFKYTEELTRNFISRNVDYNLLLYPHGTTGRLSKFHRKYLLRKMSNFIVDCYNMTSVRWETLSKDANLKNECC